MTENDIKEKYSNLLDRLNAKKRILKMTNADIQAKTGIHRKQIGEYLKGITVPSYTKMLQLLSALDMYTSIINKVNSTQMQQVFNSLRKSTAGYGHYEVSCEIDGQRYRTITDNTHLIDAVFHDDWEEWYDSHEEAKETLVSLIKRRNNL